MQLQQYSSQGYSTNTIEWLSHVFTFIEIFLIVMWKMKEFQEYGDPRFPKMVDILDRMIGLIDPMIENILSQQRDPRCEKCGGLHWFEEYAIASRLEMRWGNREWKQQIQGRR
ncbi:hypothetical protein Hdeb2414_s0028g00697881 [Helianthus debilis subsp. tardiflorus]